MLDLSLQIIVIIAKVNGLNYVVCYKNYLIKSCVHEKHLKHKELDWIWKYILGDIQFLENPGIALGISDNINARPGISFSLLIAV